LRPLAHRAEAPRRLLLLLCGLAGCRAQPTAVPAPAAPPPPVIRLCGEEVPAEAAAVRAVLLRHVAPGLAVEDARTRLEGLGFRCRYAGVFDTKPASYHPTRSLPELVVGRDAAKDERFHSLVCRASPNEVGAWGRRYAPLTVLLPYDESGRVTGVEVPDVRPRASRYAAFFSGRPRLREPVGLPVEQARALLEAEKFFCAEAGPGGRGAGGRPYLDCYAYHETPLGGDIVRVHLVYDGARTVTEAEVVQEPGEFDELRCLLPNRGDTAGRAVLKAVVFPVRLYAALLVDGLLADIALARP
jgi:hypothetical protein